jgi:hypothetical protein
MCSRSSNSSSSAHTEDSSCTAERRSAHSTSVHSIIVEMGWRFDLYRGTLFRAPYECTNTALQQTAEQRSALQVLCLRVRLLIHLLQATDRIVHINLRSRQTGVA